MKKIAEKNIDGAYSKISDAQVLISDAYSLIEGAMTDGALIVGETDLANLIGGLQCTCDDALAGLDELKELQKK